MKTLADVNQKGGVGKSFVSTQLSFYLATRGRRVLMMDFDHQRNASVPLIKSGRVAVADFNAADVFLGNAGILPAAPFVLVQGDVALSSLERQPEHHNLFVERMRKFLRTAAPAFDVCIIDTNPNPDIRYAAALICADYALSPVQLNQEAMAGIGALLNHPRYGVHKIKARINAGLEMLGMLPNLVEATPYQRSNMAQLVMAYPQLLIALPGPDQRYAFIPTRTAIAEAQGAGVPLWELRQAVASAGNGKQSGATPVRTAARDAWREVRPVFEEIERRMGLDAR